MNTSHHHKLAVALGKLEGLAGTIRYELPDGCREELRQIARSLHSLELELAEAVND